MKECNCLLLNKTQTGNNGSIFINKIKLYKSKLNRKYITYETNKICITMWHIKCTLNFHSQVKLNYQHKYSFYSKQRVAML